MRELPKMETKRFSITKIPDASLKKAFVLPGAFYGDVVSLFAEAGYERASTIEEANVVVFIGGADINPEIYGQRPIRETQTPSHHRDRVEREAFEFCLKNKIPMFGICRGAQFLHSQPENGGELWQHVDGHAGPDHDIIDIDDDYLVRATSLHHQMLIPNDKITLIAVTNETVAKRFLTDSMSIDLTKEGNNAQPEIEIEAGAYYDTRCFFVQGHPEIGNKEYRAWCFCKFETFLDQVWEFDNAEEEDRKTELEEPIITKQSLE